MSKAHEDILNILFVYTDMREAPFKPPLAVVLVEMWETPCGVFQGLWETRLPQVFSMSRHFHKRKGYKRLPKSDLIELKRPKITKGGNPLWRQ